MIIAQHILKLSEEAVFLMPLFSETFLRFPLAVLRPVLAHSAVHGAETSDEGPLCHSLAATFPPGWRRKRHGCSWLRAASSPGVAGLRPPLSVSSNVPFLLWLLIAFPKPLVSPSVNQADQGAEPFSCLDTIVLRILVLEKAGRVKCPPAEFVFCSATFSPWPLSAKDLWKGNPVCLLLKEGLGLFSF